MILTVQFFVMLQIRSGRNMKTVDIAINNLIKNLWKVRKVYNSSRKDMAIFLLAQIQEDISSLIHHLNKGGE
jgi:hypothetical protein